MAITATEARKRLFPLIKQVNEDRAPVEIISNHGRAYLVAADDYESMGRPTTCCALRRTRPASWPPPTKCAAGAPCSPRRWTSSRPWPTRTSRVEEHRLPPPGLGGLHPLGHGRQEDAAPLTAADRGNAADPVRGRGQTRTAPPQSVWFLVPAYRRRAPLGLRRDR